MHSRSFFKQTAVTALLLAAAFLAGRGIAMSASNLKEASAILQPAEENWGLSFQEEGRPPAANATFEELRRYNAWYAEETEEKVIYLTFDAGYENGNTSPILDALKKHQVPAAFFVVGNFLSSSPDLVKRMVQEGHIVANHTYSIPICPKFPPGKPLKKELRRTEELYREITGETMKNITGLPRENTAPPTWKWPETWDIRLFSGAWPMWTGTRTTSPQKKKPSRNFWGGSIPAPSSCSTAPLPPTERSWTNC